MFLCLFNQVPHQRGQAYDHQLTDINLTFCPTFYAVEIKRKGRIIPIKTKRILKPVGEYANGLQSLNRLPILLNKALICISRAAQWHTGCRQYTIAQLTIL